MRSVRTIAALLGLASAAGCYHYTFEAAAPGPPGERTVTYHVHRATYLNGFVGNGRIDTRQYCANPTKTELRVNAGDVAIAAATLLIITPHTLYVTCPAASEAAIARPAL